MLMIHMGYYWKNTQEVGKLEDKRASAKDRWAFMGGFRAFWVFSYVQKCFKKLMHSLEIRMDWEVVCDTMELSQ